MHVANKQSTGQLANQVVVSKCPEVARSTTAGYSERVFISKRTISNSNHLLKLLVQSKSATKTNAQTANDPARHSRLLVQDLISNKIKLPMIQTCSQCLVVGRQACQVLAVAITISQVQVAG
ncbi:hypothetical protein TNIN_36871 [Trichonephila inaurata madagascariensis]|uniref:Uncharacterized protein n=1 Tax=Trichonephila inaurata madagascariensis TaxID=2747483 RepID=A0A8X6Y360_9ARAC|nr:hypothetical protein TNIN_36871 [Trichonephila inaurata madagascariensis]